MGMTSAWGSGSEGYVNSGGGGGLNPWIGWGISTLLLFFLNRKSDSSSNTSSQQPSKFTEDNVNCIGQPVPVVLGRCMVKNPIVSYYGDFNSEPYTEEYGMHSEFDAASVLWPFLLMIVAALLMPSQHTSSGTLTLTNPAVVGGMGGAVAGPTSVGFVVDTNNGLKFQMLVMAILSLLISLLMNLFNNHAGRTTIQKGFLYYLGWQHIICWTGYNIGIKKIYMNVYDKEIEASTEQYIWEGTAWACDNINGITISIDDKEMFGGYDEGGGFTGDIRVYFGYIEQPKDPWMIHSMQASTIPDELKGLTPKYPMYLTCVVSNSAKNGGAYIGKQATIPEMWFEVVNYPNAFTYIAGIKIKNKKKIIIYEYRSKLYEFIDNQSDVVKTILSPYINNFNDAFSMFEFYCMGNVFIYDFFYNTGITRYRPEWFIIGIYIPALLEDVLNSCDAIYNAYKNQELYDILENIKFWCKSLTYGAASFVKIGEDLNPAVAIYEILVNKYWGCNYADKIGSIGNYGGFPLRAEDVIRLPVLSLVNVQLMFEDFYDFSKCFVSDRIDIDSLIDLGLVCEREQLGVSCLITRTAQANDYINKILNHINGIKYDDPKTGKLTFKLIRNDYDVDTIKKFDVSNTESCEFSRLDWSETTSAVEVTFTDASNKYDTGQFTFTDVSNRLITGFYTSKSVEGDYFTTTANAKWLAQMNQLANGYPLSAVNLVTNRYAYDVTIGDPIKVSWEPYGLSQVVYRVTDIDYANLTDGKISITAIEDVYGFDKLDFSTSESPQWTDPTEVPTEVSRYMFLEEPYEICRSLDTYMSAFAAQPDSDTIYWDIWRQVSGVYLKTSKSMAWSMVGRMTYGYSKAFDVDTNGFEFSILGANGVSLIEQKIDRITMYPSTYTSTSGLNLLVVDNEFMSYERIEKLPNGHYQLKGVIRGIFDTLPQRHTAESIIYFIENKQDITGKNQPISLENNSPVTEKVAICTETLNVEQEFDISMVEEHTTTRRSEQPSIMANMKFGSNMGIKTTYQYDYLDSYIFSGDILFKFKGRNKFNNYGIISQVDTTTEIKVAEDTMNVIQIHSQDVDGEWKTDATKIETIAGIDVRVNVEEAILTWEQFCEVMGDKVQYQNTVILDVLTYNSTKNLYSYDKYEKSIDWRTPRFVGVVADQTEAQTLADSYMIASTNSMVVPATAVSPQIALLYTECPIIIEGILVTGSSSPYDVKGQDGQMYRLSNIAYRIVGKDTDNKSILYPFTINEYYIFRTDFTQLVDNYDEYWQYNGTNWVKYHVLV